VEGYEEKFVGIRAWSESDRPREKLLNQGKANLSDSELLAILIGTGTRNESAVDLAKKLMQKCDDDLAQLARMSLDELQVIKGIGKAKAITILAALELGRRRKQVRQDAMPAIQNSSDVYNLLQSIYYDLPHEEFWVVYLNRSNRVMSIKNISKGGIAGTVADVRLIMKYALDQLASGIILSHNHPSGAINPSREDEVLTRRVQEACRFLDISLLDHMIVCNEQYFSFSDASKLG
jgi:DNA repair protein RadC